MNGRQRFASIDLGTNSFLLLVLDLGDTGFEVVYQACDIVRIGKKVDSASRITAEAFEDAVTVLKQYAQKAQELGAIQITAAGTSALRDAKNREQFLEHMYRETGVKIDVISGDEEARWTFLGATGFLFKDGQGASEAKRFSVLDIGGGSTEIILGDARDIRSAKSLDIGAVRLTERCVQNDPPDDEDEMRLRDEARSELRSLDFSGEMSGSLMVGVGGTITTLAAVAQSIAEYDPGRINRFKLTVEKLESMIRRFRELDSEERKKIVGLEPKRADVITAGSVILRETLLFLNRDHLIVSDFGLRFGLILKMIAESDSKNRNAAR